MFKCIEDEIKLAESGWRYMAELHNKIENDYIVILKYLPNEFTYFSLLYLNQLSKQSNKSIYIMTDSEIILKVIPYFKLKTKMIQLLNAEKIQEILFLYNLYMFTDKLIILSPTQPNGRTAYNLVEQGIIDIEEFISVGILQNREFKRAPLITYNGSDPELIEFFNVRRREV
ncbi:hypothetical protein [Lysinibacillus pakistanensis]|uniref:hypothetical protein n=1 Tax=Lysinibacillus pakistanensis TaxID=759811 RepID=UPI003D27E355